MANLSSQHPSHFHRHSRQLLPTEPPDHSSCSDTEDSELHPEPFPDPDSEPPTSWLERLVLIVAVILLLIAAINIGMATYVLESHPEQPEVIQ